MASSSVSEEDLENDFVMCVTVDFAEKWHLAQSVKRIWRMILNYHLDDLEFELLVHGP